MPWAWAPATACLDLSNGQVLNWPLPNEDYERNEAIIAAMYRTWRVWHLYHKPKSRPGAKGRVSNFTPQDVDLYAWLMENAWDA